MVLRQGPGLQSYTGRKNKTKNACSSQSVSSSHTAYSGLCVPHLNLILTLTHTCTAQCIVYNTYSTCTVSRGNEVLWQLFCYSVRQNWPEINSSQLHLLLPQQKDHHSRKCRTGSCHKMWRSLAPGYTLWVKMRFSGAYMSQCIMQNVIHWATYVVTCYSRSAVSLHTWK